MLKKLFPLIPLFLLAFFLRTLYLPNNLFFNYEQGRDLFVVKDIVENHKLTLLGPKTDMGGIFHGPLYYYLLAIPYAITGGNPVAISFFLIFISSLSIFFIYLLTRELFDKKTGLIAALLFSISYGGAVYSRWFANPSLVIPFIILLALSVMKIIHGQKKYLLLLTFSLGLIIHFEIASVVLLLPFLLTLFFFRAFRVALHDKRIVFESIIILGIFLLPYVLFDFRHDFLQYRGLLSLLGKNHGNIDLIKPLNLFIDEFNFWILPYFPKIAGLLLLIIILIKVRIKLLYLWLLSVLSVSMLFSSFVLSHFLLTVGPAFIVLLAKLISNIKDKFFIITVITIIIFINAYSFITKLPVNEGVFFQIGQRELYYNDQLRVIDYIYQTEKGNGFSIHPFTIPYFKSEGWNYLFNWYGKNRYGYLPLDVNAKTFYIIAQPDEGQSWYYKFWHEKEEIGNTLTETKKIGIITIEKRVVNRP